MTEVQLGRLLAASLHQAIGEVIPLRLEFYENYLEPEGLWDGSIGPAPMLAVLGFLRTEGFETYDHVVSRAGALAAEWTLASTSTRSARRVFAPMPRWFRLRRALRAAKDVATGVSTGTPVSGKVLGATVRMEFPDSLFCTVRTVYPKPLCGFYRKLVAETFTAFGSPSHVEIIECKATGGKRCTLEIDDSRPDL